MAPFLALDAATLTGIICLALLYGIFLSLFFGAVYVLIYRRSTNRINMPFLVSSIALFVLITADLIIRWARCQTALIGYGGTPGGAIGFLSLLNDWHEVSSTATWAATSALGDMMLIYRLWVVSNRRWAIIVFPVLLLCGSLTTGFGLVAVIALDIHTTTFASTLQGWVYSFLSLNLAQNLLVTGLIVGRIWTINMGSMKIGSTSLWPVIAILLESGALYSTTVLVMLITYVSQSNGAYVLTDMVVPIIGITFELIIVRVGLGFTKTRSNKVSPVQNYTSQTSSGLSKGFDSNHPSDGATSGSYPLQNIQVSMTREITNDDIEALDGRSKDEEESISADKSEMGMPQTWS